MKHYGRHLLGAFPDKGYSKFPELKKAWSVSFADVADARLPSTIEPHELFVRSRQAPRGWAAFQRGEALAMVPAASWASPPDGEPGSPVATIVAATPEVWVRRGDDTRSTRTWLTAHAEIPLNPDERITLRTDCSEVTLEVWQRAPWAVAAGRDRYGLWAAFEVEGVQQRLRWIPPGRFLMGSPPTEAGRWDDEGPQHWVTITKGYWLGEERDATTQKRSAEVPEAWKACQEEGRLRPPLCRPCARWPHGSVRRPERTRVVRGRL